MCRAPLRFSALLVLCALASQASLALGKVKVTKGAVVLKTPSGMEAHILPVGACVQRLLVPDRDGKLADVMAGFDDPDEYRVRADRPVQALLPGGTNRAANRRRRLQGAEAFPACPCLLLLLLLQKGTSPSGCIVGRVGGRISGSQFTLDGAGWCGGVRDTALVPPCRSGVAAWLAAPLLIAALPQISAVRDPERLTHVISLAACRRDLQAGGKEQLHDAWRGHRLQSRRLDPGFQDQHPGGLQIPQLGWAAGGEAGDMVF